MTKAFMRLALICIGSLILLFFAVFFIRQAGLRQLFQEPPHAWFQEAEWTIVKLDLPKLCAGDLQDVKPTEILYIEPISDAGEWNIPCEPKISLADFLKKSPHRRWALDVNSQNNQNISALIESLKVLEKGYQFAAMSRSQRAIRQLRKEAPQWLFASDASTLTRLHLFTAMGIETAFDFWPDFVITESAPASPYHLNEREAAELIRRRRRILWTQSESENTPPNYPVHGVMTDRRKLQ